VIPEKGRQYNEAAQYTHCHDINDRILYNDPPPLALLLDGEERSTYLFRGPQPEEYCRMQGIDERYEGRWGQNDQQNMSQQEIGAPQ